MNELTLQQKIELITLASKIGVGLGQVAADLETTISNYKKLLEEVNEAA